MHRALCQPKSTDLKKPKGEAFALDSQSGSTERGPGGPKASPQVGLGTLHEPGGLGPPAVRCRAVRVGVCTRGGPRRPLPAPPRARAGLELSGPSSLPKPCKAPPPNAASLPRTNRIGCVWSEGPWRRSRPRGSEPWPQGEAPGCRRQAEGRASLPGPAWSLRSASPPGPGLERLGPCHLAALAVAAGPAEAACVLCQRQPRAPVRAHCGHRFCRACVLRFWDEDDAAFPCPECAHDDWQLALEPGRAPLSRRLLALEEAAAGPARDGRASEAALQLLCLSDTGPLCTSCRRANDPEPPGFEPRWRKALRGKESRESVETMRKDLKDARDLHGQAESAAAVWKSHVMDRRKKTLTEYRRLRAFFTEEEQRFLQEAEQGEGAPEPAEPTQRFGSLLQAVLELEMRLRSLGLGVLLQ
ncbi:E3 ubiquitin-protein ligase RNF187 [Suncus etruscus]|uniref:E3 ubiquitin-protein ligase RNF187 n=1 Tax=Suncus etruscus TaxID=109475 RepID=UPI00211081D1|nr:E3 ubiquitin-protein ligase RNF187 [Suncus etruscus]